MAETEVGRMIWSSFVLTSFPSSTKCPDTFLLGDFPNARYRARKRRGRPGKDQRRAYEPKSA